jgi:hypothetical protein
MSDAVVVQLEPCTPSVSDEHAAERYLANTELSAVKARAAATIANRAGSPASTVGG